MQGNLNLSRPIAAWLFVCAVAGLAQERAFKSDVSLIEVDAEVVARKGYVIPRLN